MMVIVVVKVVIVHTQLTEPVMVMGMLVKVVVIVQRCSSGSSRRQMNGWGCLLRLHLQLRRVLYDIMLLLLLLLLHCICLREKRQWSGLWLELEQIVVMVRMGVVLKLLGHMVTLEKRERVHSVGEKKLGLLSLLQRLWRSGEGTHGVPVERGKLSPERPRRANNHARRVVDYTGSATATCTAGSGTLTIWR